MASSSLSSSSLLELVHRLPKIELHAHLFGCIRSTTLVELAQERHIELKNPRLYQPYCQQQNNQQQQHHEISSTSYKDQGEVPLLHDTTFLKEDTTTTTTTTWFHHPPQSLQDCFDMFNKITQCVNDLIVLERITQETLEDFIQQNIIYVEIRTTPKRLLFSYHEPQLGYATKTDYINTIQHVIQQFHTNEQRRYQQAIQQKEQRELSTSTTIRDDVRLPMQCRLIISVDRSLSLLEASENITLAVEAVTKHRRTSSEEKDCFGGTQAGSIRPNDRYDTINSDATTNTLIHIHDDPEDVLIVGVDLGGNPTKGHFQDFEPLFQQARQAGLRITLHCAEVDCTHDDTNIMDVENGQLHDNNKNNKVLSSTQVLLKRYNEVKSMLLFRPDRLGHALLIPPDLQPMLQELHIPVETCPTSNVITLQLGQQQHHHEADTNADMGNPCSTSSSSSMIYGLQQHTALENWFNVGHPIIVCTDDPGVFGTTLTKEITLLVLAFDLDPNDIPTMMINSMQYAFCDPFTRESIQQSIQQHQQQKKALLGNELYVSRVISRA